MEGAILRVEEFAQLLGCTPTALRQRVAREQVPPPFRIGCSLAWLRESVLEWLRDCSRSAGPAQMNIHLRPYKKDPTRWHVDVKLMHPSTHTEIRKRLVAPAGMSEAQARAWGERQVPKILGVALGMPSEPPPPPKQTRKAQEVRRSSHVQKAISHRPQMTLERFYYERFEPEHARMQKPATHNGYDTNFRNHYRPLLGALPLAAIDEDRIMTFRAKLRETQSVVTTNGILGRLAKMLRVAKRMRLIDVVPEVEMLRAGRARPKPVYSDDQIAELCDAAAALSDEHLLIVLLALDAGLRVSEVCALEWGDVDLKGGSMLIQHNTYRGQKQTPKGTIGRIVLTTALREALARQRKAEPIGALVLYRRSQHTRSGWAPHTPASITNMLNQAQERAGLAKSGLHLLRHTALTRLSKLGASIYIVQAVARHSRLQTTATYLHAQQVTLAREAADLLDLAAKARAGNGPGNAQATSVPPR
jgi:integrase/predicted DNA-binding transcriptional regulator AlpA